MRHRLLGILVLPFVTAIIIFSCRKMDVSVETNKEEKDYRFFNSHRTPDETEEALVKFVKGQNDKKHFVENTVKQIGYPRWDKTVRKPKLSFRGASDTTETYFIPFVRESENFVNASMIVIATPSDTSFTYRCDWQYRLFSPSSNTIDNAERFASFFMAMDRNVFGYSTFNIHDSTLFNHNGRQSYFVRISDTSSIGGKSSLLEPYQVFGSISIWFFIACPYDNEVPECDPVCDHCQLCMSNITMPSCWWEYEETGGGGNGPGGNGGGGSGEGEGQPPGCGGGAAKGLLYECGSGWSPGGGGSGGSPPSPPNDTLIARRLKRVMELFKTKTDQAHDAAIDGNERCFSINLGSSNDTVTTATKTGGTHFSRPDVYRNSTIGIVHTHQEDPPFPPAYYNESFDGPDLFALYDFAIIQGNSLLDFSIVTTRDYYYAIVITDRTLLKQYITTITGKKYKDDIGEQLQIKAESVYNTSMQNGYSFNVSTERAILSITANNNGSMSGVRVFRSPRQNVNFTLLQ